MRIVKELTEKKKYNELNYDLSIKTLYLVHVNPIFVLQVVSVIDYEHSLDEIFQVSIVAIKLESRQHVQIGPNIQIEKCFFLFQTDCSLFLRVTYNST